MVQLPGIRAPDKPDEKNVPPRGINSPGGETVLLPYTTVSCCEAEMGKPGADCAMADATRAPMLKTVLPNMMYIVMG
jgi:hypothetical protein